MNKLIWIALAFISGAILPLQAGLNTRLGKAAASPIYGALFSFIAGTAALIIYIVCTRQTLSIEGIKSAPAYLWLGGLLGAFYVAFIIYAFPKLGPGLTFGLVVAGQMFASLLLEHYNILVAQQQPINFIKILGIVLIVVGVILIRRP